MDFSILSKKYGINDDQIDIIMSCMMEDADLTETISRAGLSLSKEQVFAVASFISKSFFGEPIDNVSPAMLIERIAISEENTELTKEKIEQTREMKRLKAMEEDLLLFYAEKITVNG
jgi:hypothetical protein